MAYSNIEFKSNPGQFNIDEAQGIVECFVAGIGNKDSVGDVLIPGAFTESLKRRKPRVVWGHNWNDPIGKVLEIYEVGPGDARLPQKMRNAGIGGLYAKVQFNLNSEKGREAFANVAFFGHEQEWSIGYKTLDSIHDPSIKANILKEVELYEVSPVLHGANQLTGTISVKSDDTSMADTEKGWGMMMPNHHMMNQPRVVVIREEDDDDKYESEKPIFAEGLAQPIGGEQRSRLEREIMERTGSQIRLLQATENTALFSRMMPNGAAMTFRIGYHTPDNFRTFMFGKPELANGQNMPSQVGDNPSGSRVVVPSQMPSMPMQVKPNYDQNFGMVMPKSDDGEKSDLAGQIQALEDILMSETEEKVGRTINKRNLSKLRSIMESLQEIIASSEKEEVETKGYVIPVPIEEAFHTKQLLDPIFDYHRVEAHVTEDGIVVTSGITDEFVEAMGVAEKALGRAIGGGLGKVRRGSRGAAAVFDPNAWDGDGDGIVQEGTPFQRPAIPGVNDRSTRGRVDVAAATRAWEEQQAKKPAEERGMRSGTERPSKDAVIRDLSKIENEEDFFEWLGEGIYLNYSDGEPFTKRNDDNAKIPYLYSKRSYSGTLKEILEQIKKDKENKKIDKDNISSSRSSVNDSDIANAIDELEKKFGKNKKYKLEIEGETPTNRGGEWDIEPDQEFLRMKITPEDGDDAGFEIDIDKQSIATRNTRGMRSRGGAGGDYESRMAERDYRENLEKDFQSRREYEDAADDWLEKNPGKTEDDFKGTKEYEDSLSDFEDGWLDRQADSQERRAERGMRSSRRPDEPITDAERKKVLKDQTAVAMYKDSRSYKDALESWKSKNPDRKDKDFDKTQEFSDGLVAFDRDLYVAAEAATGIPQNRMMPYSGRIVTAEEMTAKRILRDRMGGKTLAEVAEQIGIPPERVRSLEAREVARLREEASPKEILAYRSLGLSLQDTAKLFGMQPEDVRRIEAREMANLRDNMTDDDLIELRFMGFSLDQLSNITNIPRTELRRREIKRLRQKPDGDGDSSERGMASQNIRPNSGVIKYSSELLEGKLDDLTDDPQPGMAGATLDREWAEGVIEGLRDGRLSSDDAINIIGLAGSDVFNEGKKPESERDQNLIDSRIKLSKRLRRSVVDSMSEEDMADYQGERRRRMGADRGMRSTLSEANRRRDEGLMPGTGDSGRSVGMSTGGTGEQYVPNTSERDQKIIDRLKEIGLSDEEIQELTGIAPENRGMASRSVKPSDMDAWENYGRDSALEEFLDENPDKDEADFSGEVELEALQDFIDRSDEAGIGRIEQERGLASRESKKKINLQKLPREKEDPEAVDRMIRELQIINEMAKDRDLKELPKLIERLKNAKENNGDFEASNTELAGYIRELNMLDDYGFDDFEEKNKLAYLLSQLFAEKDESSLTDRERDQLEQIRDNEIEASREDRGMESRSGSKLTEDEKLSIQSLIPNIESMSEDERQKFGEEISQRMRDGTRRGARSRSGRFRSESGIINPHEKIEMTLDGDSLGLIVEDIDALIRNNPNSTSLKAAREKFSKAKAGDKVSLTNQEYEQIYRDAEVAKGRGKIPSSELVSLLDQTVESKDGKYVHPDLQSSNRGMASKTPKGRRPNNGAPTDMTESMQKEYIFWARRNPNLYVAQRILKKHDENDGQLSPGEWRAIETLYNNLSPRGGGGRGMRSESRGSSASEAAESESVGRSRGTTGMPVRSLGDVGERNSGDTQPEQTGPQEKKFAGSRFDDVKPDNWDELDIEEKFEWMFTDGRVENSGMSPAAYEGALKALIQEEERLEKSRSRKKRGQDSEAEETDRGMASFSVGDRREGSSESGRRRRGLFGRGDSGSDNQDKGRKSKRHSGPIKTDGWQKTGGQMGSQSGGKFRDPATGKEYYIKDPKSKLHAENESLVTRLYERLGIGTSRVEVGEHNGKPKIVSEWLPGSKPVSHVQRMKDKKWKQEVQKSFVASAWLANWDATANSGNIVEGADGLPYIIDSGGGLLFRARGEAKGSRFGPVVGEMDTLRDAGMNPLGRDYFGDIPESEIARQVAEIAKIPDDEIRTMVSESISDPQKAKELADILIARRDYLAENWSTGRKAGSDRGMRSSSSGGNLSRAAKESDLGQSTVKSVSRAEKSFNDYSKSRDSNRGMLSQSGPKKTGRTMITDEATYFGEIDRSLPTEIRKATDAKESKVVDGLNLLKSLISRQEAAKTGSRRTNVGSLFMTAEEADSILDALMWVLDRQVARGGNNERIEAFARLVDKIAQAAMSTFIDKDTPEIGSRTETRRSRSGRTVEIPKTNL